MLECTLFEGKKLYKVLSKGRSAHGGDLAWSLPVQQDDGTWTPGEWHETPDVALCSRGLHLTWEPARWRCEDLEVYEVEAGDLGPFDPNDCKIVARRCRLLRKLVTAADLLAVCIVLSGHVECSSGVWLASGSSTVEASGSSTVRAYDSSTVEASGSSTVEAYDSSTVEAYDSSTVEAYDSSTVRAYGSSTVRAYDSSTVRASGSSTVRASGSSTVRAYDSSTVEAYDSSCLTSTQYASTSAPRSIGGQAVHVDRRGGRVVVVVADPTIALRCEAPPCGPGELCEGRR